VSANRYKRVDAWRLAMQKLMGRLPEGWRIIACDETLRVVREEDYAKCDYCVSDVVRSGTTLLVGHISDSGGA